MNDMLLVRSYFLVLDVTRGSPSLVTLLIPHIWGMRTTRGLGSRMRLCTEELTDKEARACHRPKGHFHVHKDAVYIQY